MNPNKRLEILAELVSKPMATYSEIGKSLGLGREWVRQIAFAELSETAKVRQARRAIKVSFNPPVRFARVVKNWLLDQGYAYCCHCYRVLDLEEMTIMGQNGPIRCNRCTRESVTKSRSTPEGKATSLSWRNSERGKESQRAATARYLAKKTHDPSSINSARGDQANA